MANPKSQSVQYGVRIPAAVLRRAKRNLPKLAEQFTSSGGIGVVNLATFIRVGMTLLSDKLEGK